MSRHLAIIRVAAVTVVKVEAVKEPVPSQRLSCLVLRCDGTSSFTASTLTTVTAATRMTSRRGDIVSRSTSGDEDWETGPFSYPIASDVQT